MNNDLSGLKIDKSQRGSESNPGGKSKSWLRVMVLLIVVAGIVALVLYREAIFSRATEVKLATTALQSPMQANAVLTANGYVVAQRKAAVASKATGRLVYLGVVEGDKVKRDQVIARLEDNDIRAQLDEAKANLKLNEAQLVEAENNFKRQKEMLDIGATPQMDFEAARTAYDRVLASIELAKARIKQTEVALENTLIRAPFDGTVLTKNADVGEVVAPLGAGLNTRAAVVTIADLSSLQVEADVSESNIQKITIGLGGQISLDAYPNHYYAGYVAKIIPTADRSKGTVTVKVAFKSYDERVLPEMSAKVLFFAEQDSQTVTDKQPVLTIPATAIAPRNGKTVVYKIENGRAVEIPVETGKAFANDVEILSGLQNGDTVIDNLDDKIVEGAKVEVK